MKTKVINVIIMLLIAAVVVINLSLINIKGDELSSVELANVEALANYEDNITYTPNECKYTSVVDLAA